MPGPHRGYLIVKFPPLRIVAVPDEYNIWLTPSAQTTSYSQYVDVDAITSDGTTSDESGKLRNISIIFHFTTSKVLILWWYSPHDLWSAWSEVEFFSSDCHSKFWSIHSLVHSPAKITISTDPTYTCTYLSTALITICSPGPVCTVLPCGEGKYPVVSNLASLLNFRQALNIKL